MIGGWAGEVVYVAGWLLEGRRRGMCGMASCLLLVAVVFFGLERGEEVSGKEERVGRER